MRELFESEIFAVVITFALYFGTQRLYQRYKYFWLNPVLLTVTGLILLLRQLEISYPTYNQGGRLISFFLGPTVVALGLPLYQSLEEIRKKGKAILVSTGLGSVVGVISAAATAMWLGASETVVISLAPKSVTTPIAMGIAEKLAGIPALTAAIVVVTGILGAVLGPLFLRLIGVTSATAYGLAMGAASHGLGTSRALEDGQTQGAMGGLAICLNGLATAVITPLLLALILR